MRPKRAMLATFAYVCMVVVLHSPASSQAETIKENLQRILLSISKLGFNYHRPPVYGCGPEVVGEECESLVAKTISGSALKQKHPCPTRYGDFPVPNDLQRFYRCHESIFTIEDCGKLYVFDPDLRYCVLKKKENSIPTPPKKRKARKRPKKPKTKPTPPTTKTPAPRPVVCRRGLSSPLLGNVTADHNMVQACKQYKNCGASGLISLNRLLEAQCKMHRPTPIRLITREAKKKSQRRVGVINKYIREARFWWVADIPLQLVWRSPGYVTTLQDCLTDCNDRFIIAGPTTCACGSISEDNPDFNVESWVRTQHFKKLHRGEGFLLHDKDAFKAASWSCTTEPAGWKKYPAKLFSQCISDCKGAKTDFVAFGKGGCRCGNAADAGKGFRSLPMAHCQKRLAGADAYSVLSVAVWWNLSNNRKTSVLWADKRPKNVIWRREACRSEAKNCHDACSERGDARWISIGVTGCECGISGTNVDEDNLDWSLKYKKKFDGQYTPARGFLLTKIKGDLRGFLPKSFKWAQRSRIGPKEEINLASDALPRLTFRHIAANVSKTVEGLHKSYTYSQVLATSVPEKAPVYRSTRTNRGTTATSSSECSMPGVSKTCTPLTTSTEKHHRLSRMAVGYFGYEKLPFFREGDITEQTDRRTSKFSAYQSKLLALASHTIELRKRFGFRRYLNKTSSGQIFYVKPTIFGDCFTGVADETGWKNLGTKSGTLRKCICACRNIPKTQTKTKKDKQLTAAIIQSGTCFCSTSSKPMGNLIASVPKPASCPKGTAREAYIFTKQFFLRRTNQFCEDFQGNPGLHVIGPGMTGRYMKKARSYFEHSATRGQAVSLNRLEATADDRKAKSRSIATVDLHHKKGRTQLGTITLVKKSLFPRTFRLKFGVTKLHRWHELHYVVSLHEGQDEKYEKFSYVNKKYGNGANANGKKKKHVNRANANRKKKKYGNGANANGKKKKYVHRANGKKAKAD